MAAGPPEQADQADPSESKASSSRAEADVAYETITVTSIDPLEVAKEDGPPECDPKTGLPKALKAYIVHQHPQIFVVPYFVNDADIDHLLELSKDAWVPSVVGTGVYRTNDEAQDLTNKKSQNRTSYSCMLRSSQTPQVEHLEQRLAHLAGMEVDYLERLNMVRYEPGQFFNRHHDGRFRPKTVFIYLNDLPEGDGGETLFPEIGIQIVPRKGCAVMWSNILAPNVEDKRTMHQGLAPRTAMKYGVNCFFNDKPLKQWEDVDSDFGDEEDGPKVGRRTQRCRAIVPKDLLEEGDSQLALQPGQLRAFTVCQEPRVSIIPQLLSHEEAAALAATTGPPDAQKADSTAMFQRIQQRLSVVAGFPVSHMDPLRVAKCEPNMTPDGRVLARENYGNRFGQKVIFIFLNDVEEGGELRFPKLGLQVRPEEGCAVVWSPWRVPGEEDPRAVHQGRPPKSGLRHSAIAVFRDEAVRSPAPTQA
mmetsp:Transcript_42113/g.89690  ORF Transcript_42113/g.89690 Transcript_42113/m.89690 type:complete len:476 (-) Transcript_42113:141-1568(-)